MQRRLFLLRLLRRWHARVGFTAMLFFLILAVTGLVLNHGRDLRLDGQYLYLSWLSRWYGIKTEPPHQAFRSGHHELIAANGRWLFDGRIFGEKLPRPIGLIEIPDLVVIASDAALYVYRDDGELVDRLGPDALPGVPIQAIGSSARKLIVGTASGTFASADVLSWQPVPRQRVVWSVPSGLTVAERRAYEETLAPGVAVQQLLLDLHSGRFAGHYGPLIVDLLAVMLLVLSVTGAWLFLVPRHRRKRH